MDIATLRRQWEQAGQGQVFRFFDSLDDVGHKRLTDQLSHFDPRYLNTLGNEYVRRKPAVAIPKQIHPVDAFPREPRPDQRKLYDDASKRGEALLSAGKVA